MGSRANGFVKENLHIIVKPIVFTFLFFLILISIYYVVYGIPADPTRYYLRPGMKPEDVARERDRVRSLESWLVNLFRGNWGISFQTQSSVWQGLSWRLVITFLLIGLSIAVSVSTGTLLVLVSSSNKRHQLRPSSFAYAVSGFFAYAVSGFFFGLLPLVGFIGIFIFGYLAYVQGIYIFPTFGIGGPYNSVSDSIMGILYHMALPILCLIVVNIIRSLLIVRSGGLTFSAEKRSRNILLLITSIDFNFVFMSVFLIELIFGLPGICNWFVGSLSIVYPDYPAAIGTLIVMLVIMLGFGYVSALLQLVQSKLGLQKEIERKAHEELEINKHSSANGKKLVRKKAFWIGLVILAFFTFMAVAAPFIAPYNPDRAGLADSLAPPEWITTLSPSLNNLSRSTVYNLNLTLDNSTIPEFIRKSPGFSATSNATATTVSLDEVTFPENRSICIVFNSDTFNYPYAPPPSFSISYSVSTDPSYSYSITYPSGKGNYTWSETRAAYNVELNFSNPLKTLSIWDTEWYIHRIADWNSHYNYLGLLQPISLAPADTRLITSKQSLAVTLSKDMYWVYRMGYMNEYGAANTDAMARDMFVSPGNYSFKMCAYIAPITSRPVSFKIQVSPIKLVIEGAVWGVMGTDHLGRDVWSRLLYGAGATLFIVLPTCALALLIGFPLGFLAGYFENWTDKAIMIVVDSIFLLPVLPVVCFAIFALGRSSFLISLLVAPFLAVLVAKAVRNTYLTRPSKLKLRETPSGNAFVSLVKVVVSNISWTAVFATLLLTSIDLLGFGNPAAPTWGRELNIMFTEGGAFVRFAWWWVFPLIGFIALFALGFLLIGISLDDQRE